MSAGDLLSFWVLCGLVGFAVRAYEVREVRAGLLEHPLQLAALLVISAVWGPALLVIAATDIEP